MEDILERFVPNVSFEKIPIKNLVSNQEYQRAISMTHVKRAASRFDLNQINPVKVSRRDGINYAFNGQHTIEIVALVSGSRDTPVWCMVYENLEYSTEADIFANQMRDVKPLSTFEIFHANVEAGSDKQIIIKDLVNGYRLEITKQPKPGGICAIRALEEMFDKYGYQVLDHVLRLAIATWEGEPQSLSGSVLKGIALLIKTYGEDVNDEVFKERLGSYSIKEICRLAKDLRHGSIGYAEALLIYYYKRTRKEPDFTPLYGIRKRKRKKSIKGDVVKREDSIAQDNDVVYDEGGGSEYVLVISAMRGYNKLNATNHKRRDQLL